MITNKQQLHQHITQDRKSLLLKKQTPKNSIDYLLVGGNEIEQYLKHLRHIEYHINTQKHYQLNPTYIYHKRRYHQLGLKLGYFIPPNTCNAGLSISHPGTIMISPKAHVGCNIRLNPPVTIGENHGEAPTVGQNVFVGSGAVIIGNIKIADNIAIGANALVNKSFLEPNITIAGNPAQKISENGSKKIHKNYVPPTQEITQL